MHDTSCDIVTGTTCRHIFGRVISTSSRCRPKRFSIFIGIVSYWASCRMTLLVDTLSEFLDRMTCRPECHSWWHFVYFDNVSWYLAKINDHFSIFLGWYFSAISRSSKMCRPRCHVILMLMEICCWKCCVASTLSAFLSKVLCHIDIVTDTANDDDMSSCLSPAKINVMHPWLQSMIHVHFCDVYATTMKKPIFR